MASDFSRKSLPHAGTARTRDRRYGSWRWRNTAKAVIARDRGVCRVVQGCPRKGRIADHIIPVFDGMPDSLFFGLDNLRASCFRHNTDRGIVERMKREGAASSGPTAVVTRDYSR